MGLGSGGDGIERWRLPAILAEPDASAGGRAAWPAGAATELPVELIALLRRRGFTAAAIQELLEPPAAPDAAAHFSDLPLAVERLHRACRQGEAVAICGDYDADGMTSTALLINALTLLGARPQAAIPSRMAEGYGLNVAMVERLAADGVGLLVTVDNGVAARDALERAQQLGVEVILTDHHTLPAELPPHLALLHPACTPEQSPYRVLAGVGLAYVLAGALCRQLAHRQALSNALHLFCVGTIADMAPLTGVNRRWLIDGLASLAATRLTGLRALQQVAGLESRSLDAETVAFQIAPRLNAVGRLGDPALVVELLTTDDLDTAQAHARRCEELNRQRRELCQAIEAEALALLEADGASLAPFLLLAQNHWHHGVIGIVAARLVERFQRPVALLAQEGDGRLRASVRAPRGFAVDAALTHCQDLLERFGGHPAAGGFTVRAERLHQLQERLEGLALAWLQAGGGSVEVAPDAHLAFSRITRAFWHQLQRLGPFGIGHPTPLFWSRRCRVVEARSLRGGHLQLQLEQHGEQRRAIGWSWPQQPTCSHVDVAYRLRLDHWQGEERLQLELRALRPSGDEGVVVERSGRRYHCRPDGDDVVIRNAAGEERRLRRTQANGGVTSGKEAYLQALQQQAQAALGLEP